MSIIQVHSRREYDEFVKHPSHICFVRCQAVRDPDGSTRNAYDVVFWCPERQQLFTILDYERCPFPVPPRSFHASPGITQVGPAPINIRVTMERPIVGLLDYLNAVLSVKRYAFVRDRLQPGSVIDCACGTGYGSNILLQRDDVTALCGVDLSDEALEFSRLVVRDPRAVFRATLPDEQVDNIVSLETLEHAPEPYQFMGELCARLKPGGRAIISVPTERWHGSHLNPFHLSNWNHARFSRFVAAFFQSVSIYFLRLSMAGPDTFSASELAATPWPDPQNEGFVAVLTQLRPQPRKRIVLRRSEGLGEVLWAAPLAAQLKAEEPERDVVVVTDEVEAFFNNPHTDLLMNTTWSGGVDIDLDRVEQVDRQMPLLQAYQQRAGMPPLAGVPELYLSEADLQFAQQLPANREVIACHALAAPAGQVWPRESWVRLVEILRDHQYLVLLLGRGEQYDLRVEGTFSVADRKLSLSQLAALIHRARFFIGPAASGLCEVARAVGRPAVVIGEHEASLATPLECLPRAASLENAAGAAAQETTSLNAVLTLVAELLGASAD